MADTMQPVPRRITIPGKACFASVPILAAIAVFFPADFVRTAEVAAGAIGHTAGFIAFPVTGAVPAGLDWQAVA